MNTIPALTDTYTLAAVATVGQPQELTLGDLRAVAGGVAADAGESVSSPFRGWSDDRDSSPFRCW